MGINVLMVRMEWGMKSNNYHKECAEIEPKNWNDFGFDFNL